MVRQDAPYKTLSFRFPSHFDKMGDLRKSTQPAFMKEMRLYILYKVRKMVVKKHTVFRVARGEKYILYDL